MYKKIVGESAFGGGEPPHSKRREAQIKFLVKLFPKSLRVWAAPTDTAFLFCRAFFFGPNDAKEKSVK